MVKLSDRVFISMDDENIVGVLRLENGKISSENYTLMNINRLRVGRCPFCNWKLCDNLYCHHSTCNIDWSSTPDYLRKFIKEKENEKNC